MDWFSKLDKLNKILIRNLFFSWVAYHIGLSVSYLTVWLELTPYGYTILNYFLLYIYLSNGVIFVVCWKKKPITKRFSNRILAILLSNWFLLFCIWCFFMAGQRLTALLSAMMALVFLYSYSTFFYSFLITLLTSMTYLLIAYVGIFHFNHPGRLASEVINVTAFFFGTMLMAIMLHRLSTLLRKQVSNDFLTKLLNRRAMSKRIVSEHKRCLRMKSAATLVMMDLDNFKLVNDTYGHDGGDAVLVSVARVLKSELRETDYIGRWGGEEYIALLTGVNPEKAMVAIQRILDKLGNEPVEFSNQFIPVSFSGGMVPLQDFSNIEEALKEADRLLYLAKSEGKNQIMM